MAADSPDPRQKDDPIVKHFLKYYRKPNKYVLRKCSICGYPLGYFVSEEDKLFYDGGCDCVDNKMFQIEPRSWDMLIQFFESQPQHRDLLLAFNIDRDGNDNPIGDNEADREKE